MVEAHSHNHSRSVVAVGRTSSITVASSSQQHPAPAPTQDTRTLRHPALDALSGSVGSGAPSASHAHGSSVGHTPFASPEGSVTTASHGAALSWYVESSGRRGSDGPLASGSASGWEDGSGGALLGPDTLVTGISTLGGGADVGTR